MMTIRRGSSRMDAYGVERLARRSGRLPFSFLFVLLVLCCGLLMLTTQVHAMYFKLDEGGRQCFIEEVPKDVQVVGKYTNLDWQLLKSTDSGQTSKISIEVRDPYNGLELEHETAEAGQFSFTSSHAGEYRICFFASVSDRYGPNKVFRVQFKVDYGEQAIDYESVAKAEHMSAIEVEVRKLNDKLRTIRQEQIYQRDRELSFRDMSESINTRVVIWSLIQTFTLAAAGVGSLFFLRRFFKTKKLA